MDLFTYQTDGLDQIDQFNGRALVAWEMGLGKTALALSWIQDEPHRRPAVVVCPASVKWCWREQARCWTPKLRIYIGEGRTPPATLPDVDLIILNYDILPHWKEAIRRWRPRTILLDEIHYCANRKAARTKAAKSVCRGVPYVLGLSGTPLTNRPKDLFCPLSILKPEEYRSFVPWGDRYCGPRWTPWGVDYNGASHLDELHQRLTTTVMLRKTKEQVLSQLPPKVRTVVPLELSDRAEYDRAERDFIRWLEEQDREKADRARRAEQLVKLGYLLRLTARLKLRSLIRWIEDWFDSAGSEAKLVAFTQHRQMLQALARRCGKGSVIVDGSVTGKQRESAVRKFQGKHTRLFIGNLRAAGVGLDGLQVADTCLLCELSWVPGDMLQAEDRLHRIGQRGSVSSYWAVASNTIEEHLCQVLQSKQTVLASVLDGKDVVGRELNIFDELVTLLRK